MKEVVFMVGLGAGMIAGALLYKHCDDAKKIVNKGEKMVKKEIDEMKENVQPPKTPKAKPQAKK